MDKRTLLSLGLLVLLVGSFISSTPLLGAILLYKTGLAHHSKVALPSFY